jgi:hypothetical protein
MNLRARTSRVLLNDGNGRALSCEQIVALIEAADGAARTSDTSSSPCGEGLRRVGPRRRRPLRRAER